MDDRERAQALVRGLTSNRELGPNASQLLALVTEEALQAVRAGAYSDRYAAMMLHLTDGKMSEEQAGEALQEIRAVLS